ncbi:MAG: protein kinase, partial [Myxococcota bacterium]
MDSAPESRSGDGDSAFGFGDTIAFDEPSASGEPMPARDSFRAAPTIGRFALLHQLGRGGMGEVYAAYDEELDRKVAVKLLRPEGDDPTGRARLVREARAMARLSHPHVAPIYECGVVDGSVFVAMEFIGGRTLGAWAA